MRRRPRLRSAATASLGVLLTIASCSDPAAESGPPLTSDPKIVAAGDIACDDEPCDGQRDVADLIGRLDPTAVLTLGDNQYPDGLLKDFKVSYDPTWGAYRDITYPSPGNHDYHTPGALGYFGYFGARAHPESEGYYSFDLGEWHLVSVNSGLDEPSDEQLAWIEQDLAADGHRCELVYWHHPRWSSGTEHGSDDDLDPLWTILFEAGVDVVLNGHEHNYERFEPLDPAGSPDADGGIRQFVVGTGGHSLYPFGDPIPGSQVRISTYGVIEMVLRPGGYGWSFVAANGSSLDSGAAGCHP